MQPAPARLLRSPDPARGSSLLRHHPVLQRLPHLLLPHLQRRSRYPESARRVQEGPRVDRCRHRYGQAGPDHGPDRQGLAEGAGFRVRQRDGGLRPAVRARAGAGAARAADHQPAQLAPVPRGAERRDGIRAGDVLPGGRRPFRRPHRGGSRGDGDGSRGDHPLPRRNPGHRERILSKKPEAPPAADVERPTRLRLYQLMVELRDFEQRAYELFLENLVRGTSHLALGQEAIAAGYAVAMRPDDYTFCTYRGHGHTLARGASMAAAMAELLGRGNGMLHGKGGSMHLTDVKHGAMGSYAIVGAHLPIAAGAAWSAQVRKSGQVAVCFFGDGTTNIGAFHEALNLAVVWKLPVVFVCENNQYMEYTPIRSVTAVEHPAADRASAYGLEPILVDGNDADEVYGAAVAAIGKARSGGGPSLIEATTYRYSGHSRADPGKYRPAGELEEWMKRDPIALYRARLLELGTKEAVLRDMEGAVQRAVDEATEAAKESPPSPLDVIERDVWADGGASWRN